jgi:hypothetical protein
MESELRQIPTGRQLNSMLGFIIGEIVAVVSFKEPFA